MKMIKIRRSITVLAMKQGRDEDRKLVRKKLTRFRPYVLTNYLWHGAIIWVRMYRVRNWQTGNC